MTAGGRVYVVDDDAGVRESLEALLLSGGYETEACCSAGEFVRCFEPSRAACVVLDVHMPGTDGLALLETLGHNRKNIPVIIMTGHADLPMAIRALRAGAADFIEKPFSADELLRTIRQAISRSTPSSATIDAGLLARFNDLTPREREVVEQMVIGLPNKLIAHRLGLSSRTVEIHRRRVMQKSGANSLSHLVRMAIRAGLDPEPHG
jgi:two-component system response regulator FixJ